MQDVFKGSIAKFKLDCLNTTESKREWKYLSII